jgi:hypothetical protein
MEQIPAEILVDIFDYLDVLGCKSFLLMCKHTFISVIGTLKVPKKKGSCSVYIMSEISNIPIFGFQNKNKNKRAPNWPLGIITRVAALYNHNVYWIKRQLHYCVISPPANLFYYLGGEMFSSIGSIYQGECFTFNPGEYEIWYERSHTLFGHDDFYVTILEKGVNKFERQVLNQYDRPCHEKGKKILREMYTNIDYTWTDPLSDEKSIIIVVTFLTKFSDYHKGIMAGL